MSYSLTLIWKSLYILRLKKSFACNVFHSLFLLIIYLQIFLPVSIWSKKIKISNLHFFLGSHANTATCTNKYLFLLLDQKELEVGVGAGSLSWKLIQDHSLRPALHVILNIDGICKKINSCFEIVQMILTLILLTSDMISMALSSGFSTFSEPTGLGSFGGNCSRLFCVLDSGAELKWVVSIWEWSASKI